jgi:hypothetical protein
MGPRCWNVFYIVENSADMHVIPAIDLIEVNGCVLRRAIMRKSSYREDPLEVARNGR